MKSNLEEFAGGLEAASPGRWAEIVAAHRPRLYAAARRFTRNHHDAEDITQETFARAFAAASQFRGDCPLGAWLSVIAGNLARSRYWYWRHRQREKTLSLDSPVDSREALTVGETLASEDPSAVTQVERDDMLDQLERGMTRLSPSDRRILFLRNERHATYDEISRSMSIPMGTVKSRLARARGHLGAIVREAVAVGSGVSTSVSLEEDGGRGPALCRS